MNHRSRLALALAAVCALHALHALHASPALADAGGTSDPSCTVEEQQTMVGGTTCVVCQAGGGVACQNELGPDYDFACAASATEQIWCNGPPRVSTPGIGCAIRNAPSTRSTHGGAIVALAATLARVLRRRRRGPLARALRS